MPVTAQRSTHAITSSTFENYGTLTFTGNYTPGGVALNPSTILGGPGSSPLGGKVLDFRAASGAGYHYALSGTGANALLKVYVSGGTELGAVAFPEPTVNYIATQSKGA